MSEPTSSKDPTRCPVCGQNNRCAIAAGEPAESCWCMTASMDARALASIPPDAQGKVCICARCASGDLPGD